jgi:hypothetical protein
VAERDELRRDLAERLHDEAEPEENALEEHAHLLFVPAAAGYTLVERPGSAPGSGTLLDLDGVGFVVRRLGRSPLPDRLVRCAFLERV